MTVGVGHTRDVTLELAVGPAAASWRGTLDVHHESVASELRITPGVAWKVHAVWIGVGLALPAGESSRPSIVLDAGFDF